MKTLELIKKDITKYSPEADLIVITNKSLVYECTLTDGEKIRFKIPITEIRQLYYPQMVSTMLVDFIVVPDYILDQKYIGMNILEAEQICKLNHIKYRLVKKDDLIHIGTPDELPKRLNFETRNDIITKVTRG